MSDDAPRTGPGDPEPGSVPGAPGFLTIAGELAAGRARTRIKRFLRWAAVVPLLVLWLVGWITPIVPGFPFLIAALFLMAPDFPPAHRLAARIQRKFPKMRRTIPRRWRRTKRTMRMKRATVNP